MKINLNKPIIISIEGNIGSGKSSLLQRMKHWRLTNNRHDVFTITEPVDEWEKVRIKDKHILELFYNDRPKYAHLFQTLICTTFRRILQRVIVNQPGLKYIICERSLLSSRHVFTQMLYEDGDMTDLEFKVYE